MKSGPSTLVTCQLTIFLVFVTSLLAGCGDVVFETDPCKYSLDGHTVQFHTYQSASWGQAECDEIPTTGQASISIVYPDKELREMRATVQVYGATSRTEAQRLEPGAQTAVLASVPAAIFPSGVISFNHDFLQPGFFVNVLKLEDVKTGKSQTLRFPFRVAVSDGLGAIPIALLLLAFAAIGLAIFRNRLKPPVTKAPVSTAC